MDIVQELMENKICHMDTDLKSVSKQLQLLQEFIKFNFGQEFKTFMENKTIRPSRLLETSQQNMQPSTDSNPPPPAVRNTIPDVQQNTETANEENEIDIKEEVVFDEQFDRDSNSINHNNVNVESTQYPVHDFGQMESVNLNDSNYIEIKQPETSQNDPIESAFLDEDEDPFNDSSNSNCALEEPMRSTSSTSMKPVKDFDWESLLIPIPKTQQQPGAATATTTKQSKATKSKPVKCSLCAVVLKNKYLLKRHVLSQHRLPHENHLTCTMCDSTFFRTEELKRHTIRHKRYSDIGQPLLSCHICHSKFLESEVLKQHIQGVHKDL